MEGRRCGTFAIGDSIDRRDRLGEHKGRPIPPDMYFRNALGQQGRQVHDASRRRLASGRRGDRALTERFRFRSPKWRLCSLSADNCSDAEVRPSEPKRSAPAA